MIELRIMVKGLLASSLGNPYDHSPALKKAKVVMITLTTMESLTFVLLALVCDSNFVTIDS